MRNPSLLNVTLAAALLLCSPCLVLGAAPPPPVLHELAEITPSVFLQSIAEVESGDHDYAVGKHGERGRFQFTEQVWKMHTTVDFHFAHDRLMSNLVAREHLRYLFSEFDRLGYVPTPYNLAACWNAGIRGGARRPLPQRVADYATRVSNLCEAHR